MATLSQARSRAISPEAVRPAVVLGVVLCAGAIFYMYAGRHLTFFFDEWNFILDRRGGGAHVYLDPHNGHLALFSVIVYKILFKLVGLHHYFPYQLVLVALHVLCCGLLYLLARPRLGRWLSLVPVIMLLLLGEAFQDLLWPFQIGFLGSVAGGLAALVLLERRTTAADVGGALAISWSLSSSGVGVAFLIACFALIVAQLGPFRRLWVIVLPAILFVIWYAGWGSSEHVTSQSVLAAPQYVADAASYATAGLAGLSAGWGAPLTVAVVVALALSANRNPLRRGPMLIAAAAGVLSFWILSAIARADYSDPGASRYLYIGGVFLLVAAAVAFARPVLRRGWMIIGAIVLAGVLVAQVNNLRNGERFFRASDTSVKEALGATDIAAAVVAPQFKPDPTNAPQITAGPYLAAARDLGTPALTVNQLSTASERGREHADQVLLGAERVGLSPARRLPALTPPTIAAVYGARLTPGARCDVVHPQAALASVDTVTRPGGAAYVAPAGASAVIVYARRFGTNFPAGLGTVPARTSSRLAFPADAAPGHSWIVQFVARTPFRICAQ